MVGAHAFKCTIVVMQPFCYIIQVVVVKYTTQKSSVATEANTWILLSSVVYQSRAYVWEGTSDWGPKVLES